MTRLHWLAVVVGLQVTMLLGWAGYHEWVRSTAPTIMLETRPVDPRDLLRGDYMVLSYAIGDVTRPTDQSPMVSAGQEIWVRLRPKGDYYEVADASWTQPQESEGMIIVRGRINGRLSRGDRLQVDYGIEKYFVPEGKGQPQFRKMVVEATVSPSHELGIKRVLLDGQPYP